VGGEVTKSKGKKTAILSGSGCYHCGGTDPIKRGFYKGRQRFKCRRCGRDYFSELDPVYLAKKLRPRERCYHCGSFNTEKAGFSRFSGKEKQKFYCHSCKRLFRENVERIEGQGKKMNFWVRKHLPSAGHLVLELRTIAQSLKRTPQGRDITELSKQGRANSLNTYRAVFGGFREALRRARLTSQYPRQYPQEQMLAELRALAKKLGRPPLRRDIAVASKKGKAPSSYFLRRAFGNVTKALKAAGVGPKKYGRREMIDVLIKLDRGLGRSISKADIIKLFQEGKGPSYKAVYREFGSLPNARKAAGIWKII